MNHENRKPCLSRLSLGPRKSANTSSKNGGNRLVSESRGAEKYAAEMWSPCDAGSVIARIPQIPFPVGTWALKNGVPLIYQTRILNLGHVSLSEGMS